MSRASRPKQFWPFTGSLSLFQQTLLRIADLDNYTDPIVITNDTYRFLVAEQARECGVVPRSVMLEPVARNTAAAMVAASLVASVDNDDQLVHVLPSDHDIEHGPAYSSAINTAKAAARAGRLVTFGITPTEPATGFGYIEAGDTDSDGALTVVRFVEKPDISQTKAMVDSGNFFWNSGMFLFSTSVFLNECRKLAPKVFSAAQASVNAARNDRDFVHLDMHAFSMAPNISVDHAVFEKSDLIAMVPTSSRWFDLGSWDSLWKASDKDGSGNMQKGPSSLINMTNSLVLSDKLHVAAEGLDDVVIIASEDVIYVGQLSQAQNVRTVVETLRNNPETRPLTETHWTSYRPWGGYSTILNGERFQVKKLFVQPSKRLSLQKHHHRSEHWVIVRGTAEVLVGQETVMLSENQSIYIPQGTEHRLSNPGKICLELIEIQTGSYLGEDDIIRLEGGI